MEQRTLNEPTYVRATLVEAFDKFENGELSLKELRAINREVRQALKRRRKEHQQHVLANWFERLLSKSKARIFGFLKS